MPGEFKCTFVIMSWLTSDVKEECDGEHDNEMRLTKSLMKLEKKNKNKIITTRKTRD